MIWETSSLCFFAKPIAKKNNVALKTIIVEKIFVKISLILGISNTKFNVTRSFKDTSEFAPMSPIKLRINPAIQANT